MTDFLIGGYGADMGGTATGLGWGRSHPDGRLEYLGVVADAPSPSWVTVSGDFVFAALEGADEIASWHRADEVLTPVRRVPSGGRNPCHLAVVDDAVIVANYMDGAVAVVRQAGAPQVLAGAGRGPLPAQDGPHAHSVLVLDDAAGGHVLTADLGADRIHVHEWRGGELTRVDSVPVPPGTGPRDLLALPDGRIAVLGEWSCELLLLEPRGTTFEVVQIVALPGAEVGRDKAAALGLSSDGRFVVTAIRGADLVAVVEVADDTAFGIVAVSCGGESPRHLLVDGDFVHVANQLSSTVTSFRLDAAGALTSVGAPVPVPSPTCLARIP